MASFLQELTNAAEERKRQIAEANKPKSTTLMEQATGPQIAAPKPTVVKPSVPETVNTKPLFQGRTNDPVEVARNRALEQAQKERDAFTRLRSRAVDDMELYRTDPNERKKANLRYQSYSDKIAAADDVIRRATEGIGKDWEAEKAAEIKAAGGDELLLRLVQLDELEAQKIKDAVARGDERRTELTENERTYNAMKQELRMLYGDKVDGWLEYVDRVRNKKQTEATLAKTAEKTKESKINKFGMSAASVLTNKLAGAGYVDVLGQKLQRGATGSDAPIDYNSPAQLPYKVTNTIRSSVSEDMGGFGSFLYNTGMSMADSLTSMPMGKAGMVLLGGAAATSAMHDAVARGATDNQALVIGLVAGAAEALLEKVSMDKLVGLDDAKTARSVVGNISKQIRTNALEEGGTNILNTVADIAVMGDKSKYETAKRAYMANGLSAEQAALKAFTDMASDFVMDVGSGALSGGLMAGGKAVIGSIFNRGNGRPTVDSTMPTIPQAEQQTQAAQPTAAAKPTVDNVMPKVQPEQKAPTVETAVPKVERNAQNAEVEAVRFDDGSEMTKSEFVAEYTKQFSRATAAEAAAVFDSYKALNEKGFTPPAFETREVQMDNSVNSEPVQEAVKPDNTNTMPNMEQTVRPDEQSRTEEVKKPAMGAADEGFNPYSHYQSTQSRFIPEGANAARPVDVPAVDPTGKKTGRFLSNVMGAQSLTEGTDAKLQEDFMSGKYGYEVKGDKAAVGAAIEKLKNSNYDTMRGATLERLESLKDLKQTVVDAQILAVEAMRNGRDADAAELFLMLGTTEIEFGQAIQAASILRKLSPEGQLEGALRVAARLDAQTKKNRGGQRATEVSAEEQSEIMQTVDDVREDILAEMAGYDPSSVGGKLATHVDKNKNPKPPKNKTPDEIVLQDLKLFAKEYMDKKVPKFEYSSAKALERFLSNEELYENAWDEARWILHDKYQDNPEMLDAAHDFMVNAIATEQIQRGIDGDISKALRVFNISAPSLARMSESELSDLGVRVVRNLMMDSKLTGANYAKMKNFILDRLAWRASFEAQRAEERRANRKRDHGLAADQWMNQIGSEIAKALGSPKKPAGQKPISKTIKQDVLRFAKKFAQKGTTQKRTAMDTLTDFIANKEKYQQAWESAKSEYSNRYNNGQGGFSDSPMTINGEDSGSVMLQAIAEEVAAEELAKGGFLARVRAEGLDVVQKRITNEIIRKTGAEGADVVAITYAVNEYFDQKYSEERGRNAIDSNFNKKLRDLNLKMSDIIRSTAGTKSDVAKKVADMMVNDFAIDPKSAKTISNNVIKMFNETVSQRAEQTLENMFKDRGKKPPKTIMQRFSELANMGAFTGSRYNQKATQKLFGEGLAVDPDLAQKFLNAPDEASREAAMEEIYKDLGEQLDTSFGEVLTRWRYTAMLLAPSTHIKNTLGSTTQFGMGLLKDALATPVEAAADKITKGKTGRTKAYLNLKSKADLSLLKTAGEFYDQHRDDIMGESRYRDTPAGKINQYKTVMKLNNPTTKVGRAVDTILRATGKVADANATAMDTEDMWISKPRFQTALAGYMKANGLTEVTDAAYEYAKNEAQKTTYRERNALSDWASSLGKHTNNPFSKVVSFFINSNFPFKRSYANMGVRAVEYSPVGLFTHTIPDIVRAAKAKDPKMVATIIDDLAANVSGTLLTGLGMYLAREGLLRARGSEDDKEREQLKREGYLENAFYVGDIPIPISFLGSVSIPLLMGASIYEAIARSNNTEEGMTLGDYLEVTSRILDPLTETTMFEGVMDAVNDFASNNPDESLSGAVAAGIATTVGNYISSLIPTVISRVAGALDRSQRTAFVEPDSQLPNVDKMVQGILKKDPIGRQTLTEKVDAYGDIVPGGLPDTGNTAKDIAGAVGYIVTPTFPGRIKTTAVDEEMRRLYNDPTVDRGKYTLFVSDAPKSFSVDGKDVKLSSEQYTQFSKDRNSGIQSMRDSVLTNENYADLPGNAKGKAMNDAKEYAEALAKAGLGVGYKLPEAWMEKLAGATPEEAAVAIIERAVKAEAENASANTYLGLSEMLSDKSIDEQLAAACLGATSQTAYGAYEANCVPAGVNVSQFLDAYGTAKAADKNNGDIQKQAALDYIEKMDLTPKQKGALASAVFSAIGKIVKVDSPVSEQWLLDNGDVERMESQMGKEQSERYNKYIKDSSVDMQTYLDFYNFQKSDEADGENRQDKIIDWLENLDASDEVKGRLFCTVYKRTSCPLKWRTGVPRD